MLTVQLELKKPTRKESIKLTYYWMDPQNQITSEFYKPIKQCIQVQLNNFKDYLNRLIQKGDSRTIQNEGIFLVNLRFASFTKM